MSEKNVKRDRKLKLMTEEADFNESAKEQAKAIGKMYEDRDKKAMGAKEHLVSQLKVTADKYRTANGVMSALDTIRLVAGNHSGDDLLGDIAMAKGVAVVMAHKAQEMASKANKLDPEDMSQLCDDFYEKEFADSDETSAVDMVIELMLLQLCQNVGPNAEDVAEFCRTADDEIEKARKSLKDFCMEHGIDFNELCGPHDNCPDCLCADCANDCKEGKDIVEGQSAYDVCEKFVKQE